MFSRRVSIVVNAVPVGVHHENLRASFYTKEPIGGTTGSQSIARSLGLRPLRSLRDVVRDSLSFPEFFKAHTLHGRAVQKHLRAGSFFDEPEPCHGGTSLQMDRR